MQKTVTEDETRPCPYLFLAVHSPSASLALLGDPERGELVLARDHPNCPHHCEQSRQISSLWLPRMHISGGDVASYLMSPTGHPPCGHFTEFSARHFSLSAVFLFIYLFITHLP